MTAVDVMTQIGIILLSSMLCIVIAMRFKLPPLIGLLFAGALIGPNILGIITTDNLQYIEVFAEIGAVLLLFSIGMEISIGKMAEVWLRSLTIWFVKDAVVFLLVYEASLLLGLDGVNPLVPLVLASVLTISSTTFFVKIVADRELKRASEVKSMITVLIIEDILAVFILAVYSGVAIGHDIGAVSVLLSVIKALVAIIVAYVILQRLINWLFRKLFVIGSSEVVVFFVLSFAMLMGFLASSFGLAPSMGAFLAGSILASVKGFKQTEETLSKLSMVFSAFFFISIGMLVDIGVMVANFQLILIVLPLLFFGILGAIATSAYLLGYRKEQAIRSGLLMLAIGEFSLIIA
ncbi:cation:proton antiporter, partial [Candidatus Micrarchaeota archaeon]|nr:cation:proton antiporter [Candidatus Micrarchaeota archaeon]